MQFDFDINNEVITICPYSLDSCEIKIDEFEIETKKFYDWLVSEEMYEPIIPKRSKEWDNIGEAPLYQYAFLPYLTIKSHIEFYLKDFYKHKF